MAITNVMRYHIADYIQDANDTAPVFCGTGFTTLNEQPTAQVDSKIYINDKTSTDTIKSYQTAFPFNTDLMTNQKAVMKLYRIGRDQKTGAESELDYIRVDLAMPVVEEDSSTGESTIVENEYLARKFHVAVEVANFNGEGGEQVQADGTLRSRGDAVLGKFNVQTTTFTAGDFDTNVES